MVRNLPTAVSAPAESRFDHATTDPAPARPDQRAVALLSKSEFLSFTSHELRTPLTTILTWAQMLKSRLDDPWQVKALETIERNVRAEVRLVDDLLDVSRIAEGRLGLQRDRVELSEVVEHAVAPLRQQAETREIRLLVSATPVALAAADGCRLGQVVSALVANAIKFAGPGGSITVRLERAAAGARLVVEDTGHGIEPERLARLFDGLEPDKRVRRDPGLGVSLFVARHIVESHGGRLQAHSDGPGKGATFTVTFPDAIDRV